VTIGEIRAVATSTSNGRPNKSAMSSYDVFMRDVAVAGQPICGANCDPQQVAKQLNTAGLGRVEFRASTGLDERLRQGTPKGALTAVQKSVARQGSDRALVGDFTSEVPAFEMVVYNDNTEYGRARQIYQFAGVSTVATYNIVPLGDFNSFIADTPGIEDVMGHDADLALAVASGSLSADGVTNVPTPDQTARLANTGRPRLGLRDAVKAIGRGIRLFLTSPRHALLILTGWGLLSLPLLLSRRRRLLAVARSA
jgi:hypothetical protein